jgi:DNA polymerase-3 subunit delta
MPKLEPKAIQKELEAGKVRPVYFLYGSERMKSRELLKRIQKTVLNGEAPNDFNLEKWDASEVGCETILDAAQSLSLMGGTKLVIARAIDEVKNLDPLVDYLKGLESGAPTTPDQVQCVLVLMSKNFDARKKSSKTIQEVAAVVACEEVEEADREPWIDYLSKRRGITLTETERLTLRGLDPWNLEIIDQEIGKLELVGEDPILRAEALLSGVSAFARDDFIDAIFCRDTKRALSLVHLFSAEMEVQLPFLGLLSWNFRQLKLSVMEQEMRSRSSEKRNPYLDRKLDRWKKHWNLKSITELEHALFQIDFALKNTRLLGLGLWTDALIRTTPRANPATSVHS